ncbi:MAG TPA: tetratricopeptide repeat protein [Pyrinomonadaceae bacterium]|jgi:tetratricopeptide (TPR) repeat protein
MRKTLFALLLCLCGAAPPARAGCAESALEVAPKLSEEARRDFETKLAGAREEFGRNPDAERFIWLGRRTAYLGRYKEAVGIFTEGLKKFPRDARLYRHRGHRLITLRCFDAAAKDLERAASLVRGRPDEVEPDGLPNARGVPTSTLQSNVWYHLGLAHYLRGDFRRALAAYREAEKVSTNPDTLVSTTHWLYMTLRRLGREREAAAALAAVGDGLDVIESEDYYKLVRLYQGKLKPTELMGENIKTPDTVGGATVGYGVGNWFLYNGRRELAEQLFRRVTGGSQWASFGYIAAEAELEGRRARSGDGVPRIIY